MRKIGMLLGCSAMILASCGGGTGETKAPAEKKIQLQSGPEEVAKSADIPAVAELVIEGNDHLDSFQSDEGACGRGGCG